MSYTKSEAAQDVGNYVTEVRDDSERYTEDLQDEKY